jgi:hypothetical protein
MSAAALAVVAIVAACGSGGASPSPLPTDAPTAVATAAATPTPTAAATPTPTAVPTPTSFPTGAPGALAFVKAYEDALLAGNYTKAWSMLGPESQANWGPFATYQSERAPYIKTAGPNYTAVADPTDIMSMADWLSGMTWAAGAPVIDSHAVLVEVTWTKIAKEPAGMEVLVVNPIPGGWLLYQVR